MKSTLLILCALTTIYHISNAAGEETPSASTKRAKKETVLNGKDALRKAAPLFGSYAGSMDKGSMKIKIGLQLYLTQEDSLEEGLGIRQSWDNVSRDWHYHPRPKEKDAWEYSRYSSQGRAHEAITPQPSQIQIRFLPSTKTLTVLQKIDAGNGTRREMAYSYEFKDDRLIYKITRTDSGEGGPVKPETRTEQMELLKEANTKK